MPATSVVWLDQGRLLMSALELSSQPLNLGSWRTRGASSGVSPTT